MKPLLNFELFDEQVCREYIDYFYKDEKYFDMWIQHEEHSDYFRKQTLRLINGPWKHRLEKFLEPLLPQVFENFNHQPVTPCIMEDTFVCKYNVNDYVKPHKDDIRSKMFDYPDLRRYFNFSINLNLEYEGGLLWLEGEQPAPANLGNVNFFRNPHAHQVTPVTAGERFVIIGWIYDQG